MQEKIIEALMIEFDPGEPILLNELSFDDVADDSLRQTMKRLVDNGKLERFDRGVYYFTEETVLRNEVQVTTSKDLLQKYSDLLAETSEQTESSNEQDRKNRRRSRRTSLSPEDVIERKYITDGKDVYGFWSGLTLENMMGVSPQVPAVLEVVSNREKTEGRRAKAGHLSYFIKKPRVEVTQKNYKTLMLLDVLSGVPIEQLNSDEKRNLLNFATKNKLEGSQVFDLAQYYPARVGSRLFESGLVNAFA